MVRERNDPSMLPLFCGDQPKACTVYRGQIGVCLRLWLKGGTTIWECPASSRACPVAAMRLVRILNDFIQAMRLQAHPKDTTLVVFSYTVHLRCTRYSVENDPDPRRIRVRLPSDTNEDALHRRFAAWKRENLRGRTAWPNDVVTAVLFLLRERIEPEWWVAPQHLQPFVRPPPVVVLRGACRCRALVGCDCHVSQMTEVVCLDASAIGAVTFVDLDSENESPWDRSRTITFSEDDDR